MDETTSPQTYSVQGAEPQATQAESPAQESAPDLSGLEPTTSSGGGKKKLYIGVAVAVVILVGLFVFGKTVLFKGSTFEKFASNDQSSDERKKDATEADRKAGIIPKPDEQAKAVKQGLAEEKEAETVFVDGQRVDAGDPPVKVRENYNVAAGGGATATSIPPVAMGTETQQAAAESVAPTKVDTGTSAATPAKPAPTESESAASGAQSVKEIQSGLFAGAKNAGASTDASKASPPSSVTEEDRKAKQAYGEDSASKKAAEKAAKQAYGEEKVAEKAAEKAAKQAYGDEKVAKEAAAKAAEGAVVDGQRVGAGESAKCAAGQKFDPTRNACVPAETKKDIQVADEQAVNPKEEESQKNESKETQLIGLGAPADGSATSTDTALVNENALAGGPVGDNASNNNAAANAGGNTGGNNGSGNSSSQGSSQDSQEVIQLRARAEALYAQLASINTLNSNDRSQIATLQQMLRESNAALAAAGASTVTPPAINVQVNLPASANLPASSGGGSGAGTTTTQPPVECPSGFKYDAARTACVPEKEVVATSRKKLAVRSIDEEPESVSNSASAVSGGAGSAIAYGSAAGAGTENAAAAAATGSASSSTSSASSSSAGKTRAASSGSQTTSNLYGAYIQGETGPEVMLYPAILALANGLLYLRKRKKK